MNERPGQPAPADEALERSLLEAATAHVRDVITLAIQHTGDAASLIVSDSRSPLARILTRAYRAALPDAVQVDFDAVTPDAVLRAFEPLRPGDLVVLVQSANFRLEAFRIRVELFKRGLKVIEHPHLERMTFSELGPYVESLAYDPAYFRVIGAALKARLDRAKGAVVESGGGERLIYDSAFEPAKLNVGDYSAMKNVGGQFPIGEVFTEPKQLARVNGRVRLFAFGDTDYLVNTPERPITLVVEEGKVREAIDSTPAFDRVLARIRAEEEPWIRELGFGMNRAFTRERRVSDVGTYERMCGIHLSLGAKHAIYAKPELKRKEGKFHVDVFAVTEQVLLDGEVIYRDGGWRV